MKFRRSSAYHLVSDCGRYTVAKVIVAGEIQYEAWHISADGKGRAIALSIRHPNSLDAMTACRRHDEQQSGKAA